MYLDKETLTQLGDNIKELIASGEVSLFKLKNHTDGVAYILRINSLSFYGLNEYGGAVLKLNSLNDVEHDHLERVFFTNEAKDVLKLNVSFKQSMPINYSGLNHA